MNFCYWPDPLLSINTKLVSHSGMFTKIALDTALALSCSFSNSALLGEWTSGAVSVERANHTYESCDRVDLRLTCAANNELHLEWRYRCNKWFDWSYGDEKRLPMVGEKIAGQDGFLKTGEFYWDGLIPREGGTKFEIQLESPDRATFAISEDPKYYYPEYIFRGRFQRAQNLNWEKAQLFNADRIAGKWTGNIRIVYKDYDTGAVKSERLCPLGTVDLNFPNYFLYQTHIYAPTCGIEEINYYIGPHLFRKNDVYAADWNGNLVLQGQATAHGFSAENKTSGYMVKAEDATWEEGRLTYRSTIKTFDATVRPIDYIWKEYILELRRPN